MHFSTFPTYSRISQHYNCHRFIFLLPFSSAFDSNRFVVRFLITLNSRVRLFARRIFICPILLFVFSQNPIYGYGLLSTRTYVYQSVENIHEIASSYVSLFYGKRRARVERTQSYTYNVVHAHAPWVLIHRPPIRIPTIQCYTYPSFLQHTYTTLVFSHTQIVLQICVANKYSWPGYE